MPFNKPTPKKSCRNSRRSVCCAIVSWPVSVFLNRQTRRAMLALTAFISILCVPLVHATAQSNQTSPVGSNLSVIFYSSPEQPFLNIFKTGGGWFGDTTGGVHYNQVDGVFNLDANGYPTSMNGIGPAAGQTFKYINAGFLMALGSAGYHSGTYVFLYDGGGGTE